MAVVLVGARAVAIREESRRAAANGALRSDQARGVASRRVSTITFSPRPEPLPEARAATAAPARSAGRVVLSPGEVRASQLGDAMGLGSALPRRDADGSPPRERPERVTSTRRGGPRAARPAGAGAVGSRAGRGATPASRARAPVARSPVCEDPAQTVATGSPSRTARPPARRRRSDHGVQRGRERDGVVVGKALKSRGRKGRRSEKSLSGVSPL